MNDPSHAVDAKGLRNFGLLMAALIVVFFAILIPWIWNAGISYITLIAAASFGLLGLAVPTALRPVYALWMRIGAVLGWINTRIILCLVFYLMFVPVGRSAQPVPENLEKPY
jgi:hypothetical protein